MSVVSTELPTLSLSPSEPVAADWLEIVADWYVVASPESVGDESLPKFSYDVDTKEYAVNVAHPQAATLAKMVLKGAVDHDKVLSSQLDSLVYEGAIDAEEQRDLARRRRVGGKLAGLVGDVQVTEESVCGVVALSPRPLFDALDAFTRLPQLSIAETELAYTARAELIDFLHGLAVHAVV